VRFVAVAIHGSTSVAVDVDTSILFHCSYVM
jgi:hypothetical protein